MLKERDVAYREELLLGLSAKIGILQLDQKRLYEELPELHKKQANLTERVKQLREEEQTLDANLRKLSLENQQLRDANHQLCDEISEGQKKKYTTAATLEKMQSELKMAEDELFSKDSELFQFKALREEHKLLKKQHVDHEVSLQSILAQSNQLQEKIEQQQSTLNDLEMAAKRVKAAKTEIQSLEQKKQDQLKKLAEYQDQLNELTLQKATNQEILNHHKMELSNLKSRSNELKETILQQQQLAGRLEQLETTLSIKRLELGKVEEELQHTILRNGHEIHSANARIVDLEAIIVNKKNNLNNIQNQLEQQERSLVKLEELSQRVETTKLELQKLDQKKRLHAQELMECQDQLNELHLQKATTQDGLIHQKIELSNLKNRSNELKETILQQQQLAGRLEQLENTLSMKRSELGKVEEKLQNILQNTKG